MEDRNIIMWVVNITPFVFGYSFMPVPPIVCFVFPFTCFAQSS